MSKGLSPQARAGLVAVGVSLGLLGVAAAIYYLRTPAESSGETPGWVEVQRVRTGDTLIVRPDDKLMYRGVRAPIDGEPLFEESTKRNETLVKDAKLRLRFEHDGERDKKNRLQAYAFVDGELINARLVREGLAYARLAADTQRYAKELTAAQAEARKARRGLWALPDPAPETEYWGDPKYGLFHRPACEEREKAKAERLVTLKSRAEGFERVWAPCSKCKP